MEDKYNMTLEQNIFLAKKELISNVYSNAKIEGINITFPETYAILNGTNVARLTVDEIQTILNLRDAWQYVIKNIEEEFNLEYVCKINEYVARNESLEWGKLRNGNVGISGVEYEPSIPKKEEVIKKIDDIYKIESITERAIEYMLYGMRNQLFWDGNKRTSIICANKILIQNGKGILVIKDSNLEEFSKLLTEYYNTNNNEKIKIFIYENCLEGIWIN